MLDRGTLIAYNVEQLPQPQRQQVLQRNLRAESKSRKASRREERLMSCVSHLEVKTLAGGHLHPFP